MRGARPPDLYTQDASKTHQKRRFPLTDKMQWNKLWVFSAEGTIMAFNQELSDRVRVTLAGTEGLDERVMFGGIGFLIHGNMACGVIGDRLIVRVGPESYEAALQQPNVREFDYTGQPMKGWITVLPAGTNNETRLKDWVSAGLNFTRTLPHK